MIDDITEFCCISNQHTDFNCWLIWVSNMMKQQLLWIKVRHLNLNKWSLAYIGSY